MKTNLLKSKDNGANNPDHFISKIENSKLSNQELNHIMGGEDDGGDVKNSIKLG